MRVQTITLKESVMNVTWICRLVVSTATEIQISLLGTAYPYTTPLWSAQNCLIKTTYSIINITKHISKHTHSPCRALTAREALNKSLTFLQLIHINCIGEFAVCSISSKHDKHILSICHNTTSSSC